MNYIIGVHAIRNSSIFAITYYYSANFDAFAGEIRSVHVIRNNR